MEGENSKKGYQDLVVWQKSIDLVTKLYKLTSDFPSSEQYGLTSQIRRCSVSIAANLAEGYGRSSSAEFANFISIAVGSATELETLLIVSKNIGYLNQTNFASLNEDVQVVLRMSYKLRQSIRKKSA